MKEVSCRLFDVLLRDLRARGIDAERLVEGTSYSPAHLADKDERVDWSAFLRMMQNARTIWSRDQLIGLGERSTEGPLVQFIGVVARIRFSVATFYEWVCAPDGLGSQMISCTRPTTRLEGPGRLVVEVRMAPGFAPSEELFLITQGTYAAMPKMMGAPPAKVRLVLRPDGADFHVRFTEPRGLVPAVRRLVTAPFNLRRVAHELQDAHTSLLARYEELDTARAQVEVQREVLDLAYQFGQQIWSKRDLREIGDTATKTLLGRRGLLGVRLTIRAFGEICAERGERTGAPTAVVELAADKGRLEAWTAGRDPDCQRLLELVAPTIALAIDNAVAYRDLAEYQVGLEKLVDERTTELRSARDQLAGLVERLEEAKASRENFFANISHEIRTPLSLILLAAGDVERRAGAVLDPRAREGLGAINEGARKLLRLVDELLLLAAGQAGKLELSPEPTDLVALTTHLASAWRPAAEANDLELHVQQPASLVASVDPIAFERVASNLLSNAVKYTPRGGRIDLELALEPDGIRFSVLDTGRGIEPELATRLFRRFERGAGDDRRRSGTGIGLALVKQLVEAHGGTVLAEPRAQGGTELRVQLPRSRVI
ncbi:MAG TPA: HAMP domain-containing sensor histidine kinase, partial [Kofleriaceae bacterium]|nr:HAMP domain-containing sensor histidine kinase [Kofleriaceae bacterium]